MAIGFVLVSTAAGMERSVYDLLLEVQGVVEAMPLFGEYDLIAKIESDDWMSLAKAITGGIRTIPGVVDTKTLTDTPA